MARDDENTLLIHEFESKVTHVEVFAPKTNPEDTVDDVRKQVGINFDLAYGKSLLNLLLKENLITQTEYDKCLKYFVKIYLNVEDLIEGDCHGKK